MYPSLTCYRRATLQSPYPATKLINPFFDVMRHIVRQLGSAWKRTTLKNRKSFRFDQNGTVLLGVTTTSFFVYSIDSTSGTPTSPLPALGVAHDERYAITN